MISAHFWWAVKISDLTILQKVGPKVRRDGIVVWDEEVKLQHHEFYTFNDEFSSFFCFKLDS